MKQYNGMYLGIVVQNNDPEYRGRVKVYVPHIQANVYESWYNEVTDKQFKFVGDNINSDLNKILPELKTVLPWAENAMPSVGSTGSGRYNAHLDVGTISDSNRSETLKPGKHQTDVEKKYRLNDDDIGEKPGKVYESNDLLVGDAFTNLDNPDVSQVIDEDIWANEPLGDKLNGVNRPNIYAFNYKPTTYSNCAKGSFSIPNVGSHVWVFFQNGDALQPVMFGVMHGKEDWRGIYDSHDGHGQDYPGAYENISRDEERVFDNNAETYRNKYVINQKGGVLEFVNTDNREILKMTHYSGSFKEFNNNTNIEFATRNDQKLVQQDSYDTVKGFRNEYTERDYDQIVKGDRYHRTGYMNINHHIAWKDIMQPVAQIKALFDVARVNGAPGQDGTMSQKKLGTPTMCPVCTSPLGTRSSRQWQQWLFTTGTNTWFGWNGASMATVSPVGEVPGWVQPPVASPVAAYAMGQGDPGSIIPNFASIKYLPTPGLMYPHDKLNLPAITQVPVFTGPGFIHGEPCPACNTWEARLNMTPPGMSPSSQGGLWTPEPQKLPPVMATLIASATTAAAGIEEKLGMGGSETVNIAKHKVENIGLVMNDFPSIRTDQFGKMGRDKLVIHRFGMVQSMRASPLVEAVHVDDLPGGSLSQNIANRWNVHVGAGGVSIKSYGRVELGGSMMNIAGDQVNIGSKNEVNIDGGQRLSVVADIINIRQRDRGQVLVDSNLGVSQNVIVGGGLHVEGELTCNHITAPVEIQETERAQIHSKALAGLSFVCRLMIPKGSSALGGNAVTPNKYTGFSSQVGGVAENCIITLTSDSTDNHIVDYGHSHLFKNAAMTLMSSNDLVREKGKSCNNVESMGPGLPKNPFEALRAPADAPEVVPASRKVKLFYVNPKTLTKAAGQ